MQAPPPEAPAEAPIAWSVLPEAVRSVEAPLLLHLRLEADGRVALRSAVPAAVPAWREEAVLSLRGDARAQARALRVLGAHVEDLLAAGLGGCEDSFWGYAAARVVLDVDPQARWQHVQWVVAAAWDRGGLWMLTFLDPQGGAPIPQRLPRDNERRGEPAWLAPYRGVEFVLLGPSPGPESGSGAPLSGGRLRVKSVREARSAQAPVAEAPAAAAAPPVPASPGPAPAPDPWALGDEATRGRSPLIARQDVQEAPDELDVSVLLERDLPADPGPVAAADRFQAQLADDLRAVLTPSPEPAFLSLHTPPPRAAALRAGDVLRVLACLRDLGLVNVSCEGAAPPKDREGAAEDRLHARLPWRLGVGQAAALRSRAQASDGDGLLVVMADDGARLRLLHVAAGAARAQRWARAAAEDGRALRAEELEGPLAQVLPGWSAARVEQLPVLLLAAQSDAEALTRLLAGAGLRRVERLP